MPMPPSQDVLEAFAAVGEPHLLQGGQGKTWRVGSVVLKPAGLAAESRWQASTLDALPDTDRVRIARPVRAVSGDWLHQGWEAWHHLAGRTDPTRCDAAIEAGAVFHELLAAVPRPDFLDIRDNWWSRGDRIAWDLTAVAEAPVIRRLMKARERVSLGEQLVHGDLLGNVLYEPGLPPAIIDWAPYWRSPAWAAAVAVIDALCWHGADNELLERWSHLAEWPQMLLRALLYRMITDLEASRAAGSGWQPHPAYEPVVKLVLTRAELE
ncbi:TIGR02569 family protein [Glycomyces tenuis]|uniref:TIGR02569 family protein n=1 Tax=Glycomyces tenuis TaxID=58116 RepID=UPI00047D4949|nr:TIGR02569 family protein [Glycomyces tenuis]